MTDKFLTQDEVDSLLKGVTGESDEVKSATDPTAARSYDLATQERIVRGRMPTLELINERFARLFRIGLFNFLRRRAEVAAGTVRVTKYSEFLRNLVVPTNLNIVQIKPLRGTALIVIDPDLVFLIVDNFFGGDGRFQTRVEGRDFTQTEIRTVQRILSIIFEAYTKSWETIYPIDFEYVRSEMHTQFANIATPNEVVVATSFTVEIGSASGEVHFCIPYSAIEPIRDLLTSPLQGETLGIDKRWVELMTQQIQSVEVEMVANLGSFSLTLNELLSKKVGDVIPFFITQDLEATIENVPVMSCRYGFSNGQYALRVEKLLKSDSAEYVKGESNGD